MLVLYDVNHNKVAPLPNAKSPKLERYLTGEEDLSFSYPQNDTRYSLMQEECYVRTSDNEYVIKEIDEGGDYWTDFVCKVNVDDLKGTTMDSFAIIDQDATHAVNLALAGTGWAIGSCDVTKLRSVSKQNSSVYDILAEIQTAYSCEMRFDAINKLVYIYQAMGSDKGAYFIDKLNLKQLEVQRNSYDFCTRLIPIGKDGLTITAVNGGKNYVENYQYSNKVFTTYWEDNRYIDAQSLLDDAILRLQELSKPSRAYKADVLDLANISAEKYSILDYNLGDTVTLVDATRNIKDKQRIVKTTEYLEEPEQNQVELANRIASLDVLQVHLVESADTVNSITTTDGQVLGSKVDGIDYSQVQNVSVGTAVIQDGAIVTAKIGDAQITTAKITAAAIGTAQIQNAAVTNAQIADATIDSAKIANGAIGTAQIQDAAIGNAQIADASIDSAKIADAAIGTAQIQTGAITTALIDTAAVGTTQIADGSITDAKIVNLTANKITAGTIDASEIDVINLHADNITVGTINGQQITDGAITNGKLASGVVTGDKIAVGVITADKLADGTITVDKIADDSISSSKIQAGAVKENQLNWATHLLF